MEHSNLEHLAKCPICRSSSLSFSTSLTDHSITREQFDLTDCRSCGLRITNPRPSIEALAKYYDDPSYISHSNTSVTLQDKLYQLVRRWALTKKYRLLKPRQPNGRVLDIGCGTGEFLAYLMGRGYQVTGVEPNSKARQEAIANHAIEVLPHLDQVPAQEQFQVITMWHVLEHVPDLHQTMKRLFASLSDNGILLVAVPDRDSWDASFYGHNWAAWDVPRHLTHFRRRDMQRLLHDHGFELLETRPMWLDAFYIALLSERYAGVQPMLALFKALLFGTWSNLQAIRKNGSTSSSLFIAKKLQA